MLDRAGLGIAGGELPRGDLADEVVAPAAVAEQAVGLGDGDPPGEIGEGVPGAALRWATRLGSRGASSCCMTAGARPVSW